MRQQPLRHLPGPLLRLPCVLLLLVVAGRCAAGEAGEASPAEAARSEAHSPPKPRLLVTTDISSLTASVREPDDGQSMIRLMLYTCDLDVEGLVASSNMGHGQVVRPELIREVVEAYGKVRPNLLLHRPGYPAADELLGRVKGGQPVAGPNVVVSESVGDGKDTEGSRWIIACANRPDPRPLWVTVWGGSADLAQALWRVRQSRPPAAVDTFVGRLRVHSIHDQDSTGPWIKENFPKLFYITRGYGMRGMYRGGDASFVSPEWVERHARGRGALGALYPVYDGGDIWSSRLGKVRGVKEGDTPSYLGLLPNGLNAPEEPGWGGWGGRFAPDPDGNPAHFTDAADASVASPADPDPHMSTVYRWRPDYQADFAARLDWCVKPDGEANHAPTAAFRGEAGQKVVRLTARAGARVELSAAGSSDADAQRLTFGWSVYREAGSCDGEATIAGADRERAELRVPGGAKAGQTVHVILRVTDDGSPPLAAYRRIVVTIE